MFGEHENIETDKNDKQKENTMVSVNNISENKDIVACKSNPSTFICSCYGSISINEERNLFSFGRNINGYLGHEGKNRVIKYPKQISNLCEIKMVACGLYNTACIDHDGNLFTFGSNYKGQLGIGKDYKELPVAHIPQKIINIPPIDSISCKNDFIICVSNDEYIYSFGGNEYGQLGLGSNESFYLSPQLIRNLNDVEFIQCGGNYVICKTYSNEYYSWGFNHYGQLGQSNIYNCNKPIKCSNWPEDIIDIKCSDDHTLLLTLTGYVYSFGSNDCGQLGLNDINIKSINIPTLIKDIPFIKRIECGYFHSMCIDINNNLWVFGYNESGQLGLGDEENRCKPILNEALHDIIDISSGGNHTFVKNNKTMKYLLFGDNEDLQLGIEISEEYQLTPIQVFKDKEDIWASRTRRSKQKSARK